MTCRLGARWSLRWEREVIGGRWLESCRGHEEFIQRRASLETNIPFRWGRMLPVASCSWKKDMWRYCGPLGSQDLTYSLYALSKFVATASIFSTRGGILPPFYTTYFWRLVFKFILTFSDSILQDSILSSSEKRNYLYDFNVDNTKVNTGVSLTLCLNWVDLKVNTTTTKRNSNWLLISVKYIDLDVCWIIDVKEIVSKRKPRARAS